MVIDEGFMCLKARKEKFTNCGLETEVVVDVGFMCLTV